MPVAATVRYCVCGTDEDSELLELLCFVPFGFDGPNELLLEVEGETYSRVRGNEAHVTLNTAYLEAFGRFGPFCGDMYARGIIGFQHATNWLSPILQWFPRSGIC
jgi:hypothetical protein